MNAEQHREKKMSRYINADLLIAKLKTLYEDEWNQNVCTSWANAYSYCEELVEDLPTAIVNCDRCMEWHPRESTSYGFCIRWGQYTKECDYCSYGKQLTVT